MSVFGRRRVRSSVASPIEGLESRALMAATVLNETVNNFGESEFADDVQVQKDDRIFVLGHTDAADPANDRLFLALYDTDGSLDRFFGDNGRIFGEFANFRRATSMTIDRSGRILVAGVTSDPDPAVAVMRFTRSGFLDRSYGINGLATLQAGTGEVVNDIAVDSSGRVTVVGQTTLTTGVSQTQVPAFMVARFDVFGQADIQFGGFNGTGIGDGAVAFPVGIGESGATSVALDGSRIVIGGFGTEQSSGEPPEKRFTLVRLEREGQLDDDFGQSDGIVITDFGLPSTAQDIAIAKGGKIVAAGNAFPTVDNPAEQILVARFDRGGALDPSFGGGDGFTFSSFGGANRQIAREIVVDSKDRVLLAGEIADGGEPTGDRNDDGFLLARYLSDGTPDTGFGPDGGLIHEVTAGLDSFELVAGLTLQTDGKNGRVVVAGNTGTSETDQDLAVVRYATDATLGTGSAKLNGSKLVVKGTDRADIITVSADTAAGTINVTINGATQSFPGGAVKRIEIGSKDGDDEVTSSVGGVVNVILGGDDDDELKFIGDAQGRIEGQDDDDDITGSVGSDRLRGGRGDDLIFGGDGNDDIAGDAGNDRLFGEDGNDDLKSDDGWEDEVDGGNGDDDAFADPFDFITRVDDVEYR